MIMRLEARDNDLCSQPEIPRCLQRGLERSDDSPLDGGFLPASLKVAMKGFSLDNSMIVA